MVDRDRLADAERARDIYEAMSAPGKLDMLNDFRALYKERVDEPRERLFSLLKMDPHIAAIVATDDVLDASIQLLTVVMDGDTCKRISALASDPNATARDKAMAELELIYLIRSFLSGLLTVKAHKYGFGPVEVGELKARTASAKFTLGA